MIIYMASPNDIKEHNKEHRHEKVIKSKKVSYLELSNLVDEFVNLQNFSSVKFDEQQLHFNMTICGLMCFLQLKLLKGKETKRHVRK